MSTIPLDLPGWKIEDPDIDKLDKLRSELNRHFCMTEEQIGGSSMFLSVASIRELQDRVENLEAKVHDLYPEAHPEFDSLVLEDVRENVKRVKAMAEYSYGETKRGGKIATLLAKIYGSPQFERLQKMMQRHIRDPRLNELAKKIIPQKVSKKDPDLDEVRAHIKDNLDRHKEYLKEFCESTGITLPRPRINVFLATPGQDYSYSDSLNRLSAIQPYIVPEDGRSFGLILTILHEYAGHGLNSMYSRRFLPQGLNPQDDEYHAITQGIQGEGIALHMEAEGIRWLERKSTQQKLGITEKELEEIRLLKFLLKMHPRNKLPEVVYDLKCHHEFENEGNESYHAKRDASKKMEELTDIRRFRLDFNIRGPRTISDTLVDLQYIMGEITIRKIYSQLTRRLDFSPPYRDRNRTAMMQMLLYGYWISPKAKEQFVLGPLFNAYRERGLIVPRERKTIVLYPGMAS